LGRNGFWLAATAALASICSFFTIFWDFLIALPIAHLLACLLLVAPFELAG
jgi:hypothetical protein